jgi:hypothetical protein
MLDTGYWMLDAGYWSERSGDPENSGILDAGYWMLVGAKRRSRELGDTGYSSLHVDVIPQGSMLLSI